MLGTLRQPYRSIKSKFNLLWKLNWFATFYFNFKMFSFGTAKKFPVFFYGSVKFRALTGEFFIDAPIRTGMIGFGQPFELISRSQGIAEIYLMGKIVCKGHVHFGKDYLVYVGDKAYCEFGHMFGMGSRGKIMCYDKMIFGQYVRVGFESQIIDSNWHQMINLETTERLPLTTPIRLGDFNWIGNRSSIMPKTVTSNYCIVASNSLCNSDYSGLGSNILIGGIPSKLLRQNLTRDWQGEHDEMDEWLKVWK